MKADICIIGGGASGMAAAISAKEKNPKLRVIIIEKKGELGKKLLATGNGKCNLSNISCKKYLETLSFFNELGVMTRTDSEGRIYPYTEEAKALVDALKYKIESLGIEVIRDCVVETITKENSFFIKTNGVSLEANKILLSTGGKAGPEFGCSGDGYRLAKKLGHTVTSLSPILTAIECTGDYSSFGGIRAKAKAMLFKGEKNIFEEEGEIQFTKDGISGICVFNMTRFIEKAADTPLEEGFRDYNIYVDFLPGLEGTALLEERKMLQGSTALTLLRTLVREPLAKDILVKAKVGFSDDAKTIDHEKIKELAGLLKTWPAQIKMVKGWKSAQATKGGIPLEEINLETMESNFAKNLYFAGEIIDVDGPCGGYNLQNAWETGIKAGKAMANV